MSQSMTVNGVLRSRASSSKQRPGRARKREEQERINPPRKSRKKSNADLVQEQPW